MMLEGNVDPWGWLLQGNGCSQSETAEPHSNDGGLKTNSENERPGRWTQAKFDRRVFAERPSVGRQHDPLNR